MTRRLAAILATDVVGYSRLMGRDENGTLVARVRADAFCHSMVRSLVGASVAVGTGRLTVDDVVRLRDAGLRTSEFKVHAARGLTLMEVGYPSDELLGLRADQTRRRRQLDVDVD